MQVDNVAEMHVDNIAEANKLQPAKDEVPEVASQDPPTEDLPINDKQINDSQEIAETEETMLSTDEYRVIHALQ